MKCCVVAEDGLSTKTLETSTSKFYCCGVVPNFVNFACETPQNNHKFRHDMLWCKKHEIGVELGKEADENENTLPAVNVVNPPVPYNRPIPDILYVGSTIDITGHIHSNAQSFTVNLLTSDCDDDQGDICFHFNPRFDRRVVVRNTLRRGSWETEEIAAGRHFPFVPCRGTRLLFFVADGQFMVSVNNIHFCSYTFRIPVHNVRALQILGDITLKHIRFCRGDSYPLSIPSRLPRVLLPKHSAGTRVKIKRKTPSIQPGTVITMRGRVSLLPQNFYINLQVGQFLVPHPIIPFHMNLRMCQDRMLEQQMIYNSWIDGRWGTELKPDTCPFMPGTPFVLKISYFVEGFHVAVNNEFVIAFPLRLPKPMDIDTIYVEGLRGVDYNRAWSMGKAASQTTR